MSVPPPRSRRRSSCSTAARSRRRSSTPSRRKLSSSAAAGRGGNVAPRSLRVVRRREITRVRALGWQLSVCADVRIRRSSRGRRDSRAESPGDTCLVSSPAAGSSTARCSRASTPTHGPFRPGRATSGPPGSPTTPPCGPESTVSGLAHDRQSVTHHVASGGVVPVNRCGGTSASAGQARARPPRRARGAGRGVSGGSR